MEMLGGKWLTQMVSTAATLGIPDALADAPRAVDELAESLGCHSPSLSRLLRAMSGAGLVEEGLDGRFGLTEVGAQLRSDALGPLAIFVGSESQWAPWPALGESIRTGEPAFDAVHGVGLYEHLESNAADAALYDAAVEAFTRHQAHALAQRYDFSRFHTVVDVGGGRGTLLLELLKRFPALDAVLFDLPHVASATRERLKGAEGGAAVRVEAGDFFVAVPQGADAYVLKHVLHNWDDDAARQILARCAEAMGPSGRVLVVDNVVLPGNRPDATRLLDLEMLVLTRGGRERTKPELRHLFHEAGLVVSESVPLIGGTRLLVGKRRE
ncbi:MAG: methyltransferase [Myxococcota bacterium]